ncbi:MAG: hypothetical protein SCARUB_00335 [Candidatus Scalindua rubra]|uniref:Uncharacterized protein n=1 Tax=Candidatus Scalindua rubra TaxID=1872076 RepID=A0A1E3XFQ4_9BACT|nr:MAG: hypothetical protein SCARUB_00335 [Candidatus Scalindua rubra]
MDWAQVLAIVLPVMLAIIIGLFYSNRRFDDVNRRFDDMNRRIDDTNRKIDDLKTDLKADIREIRNLLLDFLKKEAGV